MIVAVKGIIYTGKIKTYSYLTWNGWVIPYHHLNLVCILCIPLPFQQPNINFFITCCPISHNRSCTTAATTLRRRTVNINKGLHGVANNYCIMNNNCNNKNSIVYNITCKAIYCFNLQVHYIPQHHPVTVSQVNLLRYCYNHVWKII